MGNRDYGAGRRGEPVEIRLMVGGQGGGSSYDDFYAQLGDVIRRENPYSGVVVDDYISYERFGRAKDNNSRAPTKSAELDELIRVDKDARGEADLLRKKAGEQIGELYGLALEATGGDADLAAGLVADALESASLDFALDRRVVVGDRPDRKPEPQAGARAAETERQRRADAEQRQKRRRLRRFRWAVKLDEKPYTINKALVIPYAYENGAQAQEKGYLLIGYQGPGSD